MGVGRGRSRGEVWEERPREGGGGLEDGDEE
jgi:hypothetical protein